MLQRAAESDSSWYLRPNNQSIDEAYSRLPSLIEIESAAHDQKITKSLVLLNVSNFYDVDLIKEYLMTMVKTLYAGYRKRAAFHYYVCYEKAGHKSLKIG